MSAPKIIVQILVTGTQIFGKALFAAGQQAVKNAKAAPQALGNDVAGVQHATSGSLTDKLTREHRLTLDEARLILNSKREDQMEQVLERYEHLFKVNSPPESTDASASASASSTTSSRKLPPKYHSHYLQSKVVRARERIVAELTLPQAPTESSSSTPPPPDSKSPPPSS